MTYWIIERNEPLEVELVGKYIPEDNWFESKFRFIYQVRAAGKNYADEVERKREEIYLTKEDAELAISARENLDKIREAERVIEKYKDAVEVIKKAKKEGLTDLDFVFELSDEVAKEKPKEE